METTTFYNHTYENPPPTVTKHARKISNSSSSEGSFNASNKKQKTGGDTEDEEKRKNFLERNRIGKVICIVCYLQVLTANSCFKM